MKASAIYSKTGKGVQEASGKTRDLSRADRAVLSAIDGKSTVAEVGQKLGKTTNDAKFVQLFEQLERDGFIRLIAGGEAARPAAPSASSRPGTAPITSTEADLDFTQSISRSVLQGASKPVVDLAAHARAEAERKLKEEADLRGTADAARARGEAEAKAKAEREAAQRAAAESRARAEAEARARADAEARARTEVDAKKRLESELLVKIAEAERLAKEAEERARKDAEEKARRESEALRQRLEDERKAKEEAERQANEEAERRAKEQAERRAKEEAERRAKEEAERRAKEEAERKAKEEAERRAKEEAERRAKEEAERWAREEEQARREKERVQAAARQAEQPAAADLAASLLADLDSFSQRESEEREAQEEVVRKADDAETLRLREQAERRQREAEQGRASEPGVEEERPAAERSRRNGKARRRLAAIVAADVVGYSRLMGIDEEGTLSRFRRILNEIVRPQVDEYGGRIVKTAGDGLLLEFPSVVEAARWAAAVQTAVASDQAGQSPARQIAFRMGVNLGDVIDEDNDIFGDGVNVAARLEGLAERGGICVSGVVYDHIHDKVACKFEDLGPQKLKNIARPMRVYRLRGEWETVSLRRTTDLESLPHPSAMAGAAAAGDDVEVRAEDLDMEEVKRDQQALSPEARRATRERERTQERFAKGEPEASGPSRLRLRLPRKWGKMLATSVIVLLVAAVGAVQFMPVPTADYERAASAALGQRVTIRSARMSVFSGLKLKFDGVTIGNAVKVREASASVGPGLLFGARKSFGSIELDDVVAPQAALGGVLFGALQRGGLEVGQVVLKGVRLQGTLTLPPLDAKLSIGANGALRSATVRGPGNFAMTLAPRGDQVTFDATADNFSPPFVPALALSNYAMKGRASRGGMNVTHFDAQLYDGTIAGSARIRWQGGWNVEGSLEAKTINAGVLAPTLLSQGTADANGTYSMSAADPAKLLDHAHLEGSFKISKGVLGNFDLARAIRTKGQQVTGLTTFVQMSGNGSYDGGAVSLRNIAIGAGALNAGASAEIAPNGALSGRIIADVKTPVQMLSATLRLGGTVKTPQVTGQ
ncbi:MAG TPA: adenylate/guanylate cyclase domain-containing protein [Burkholderiales bacterium]|nr:adenylate/guanylate cyclase domain-containing protein [Burkholderiales bacterium]